jgi:hypothetical protein
MGLSKIAGQSPASLTQNLQMMNGPRLNQLVFIECGTAAVRIFFNQLNGFEHIGEAKPVVSHLEGQGVAEDRFADAGAQPPGRDHVDRYREQFFELALQPGEIE